MEQENRAYVENMIQGDQSAFDALYHLYSGKLYRMAYFITGNKSDSEDILQETFVKCYLHRKDLKAPEGFESWIYRILVRTAWKQNKRNRDISLDEILENKENVTKAEEVLRDQAAGPLQQLVMQEKERELWQAVAGLNVKYRTVILLYYYNDLSTKEIAGITGILEGTIKSRLFKARKLLRASMEQEQERRLYHEGELG